MNDVHMAETRASYGRDQGQWKERKQNPQELEIIAKECRGYIGNPVCGVQLERLLLTRRVVLRWNKEKRSRRISCIHHGLGWQLLLVDCIRRGPARRGFGCTHHGLACCNRRDLSEEQCLQGCCSRHVQLPFRTMIESRK